MMTFALSEAPRATRVCARLTALAIVWVLLVATPVAAGGEAQPLTCDAKPPYLLSTPQIPSPLCPLAHLGSATGHISVRSAVVTVADPLETHFGRMFDSQLSALIRAFDASDYVIDGFALTWDRGLVDSAGSASNLLKDGSEPFREQQRRWPSVLVFRRDRWREGARDVDKAVVGHGGAVPGAEYYVVFLVGESPAFGVHPEALGVAARCAMSLVGPGDATGLTTPCDRAGKVPATEHSVSDLHIIGPTFSGSLQSLTLVLGPLLSEAPALSIQLVSPSATVESNDEVERWVGRIASTSDRFRYRSLAIGLEQQLKTLAAYRSRQGIQGKVVVLAEESTFGQGVSALLPRAGVNCGKDGDKPPTGTDPWAEFVRCTRVTSFSQNLSAIRAEHSDIDRQRSESWRSQLHAKSRLLELDLSGIEEIADRPPAYHRALSARSDELMLYGTFDALREYVRPSIVVIVATDVRDRLFLLNEVRKLLPRALPVLMEMDYLTAHPDYRKISRGSIVIPAGDTMLCMDGDRQPTNCGSDGQTRDRKAKSRLAFPADYAANMFRAALDLLGKHAPAAEARLWVTTLAGFQSLDPTGGTAQATGQRKSRGTLLAADGRLLLERPAEVFFVAAGLLLTLLAWWLITRGETHLVMLAPWRNLNLLRGVKKSAFQAEVDAREQGPHPDEIPRDVGRWLSGALVFVGLLVVVIALWRVFEMRIDSPFHRVRALAHGRDLAALICLCLLNVWAAILAGWRLFLWRTRRCGHLRVLRGGTDVAPAANQASCHGQVGLSFVVAGIVAFLLASGFGGLPASVDSPLPALCVYVTLLSLGIWFLFQLKAESRHLACLAQLLAPTAELPRDARADRQADSGNDSDSPSWASPLHLRALPQSPFSLCFRKLDLAALFTCPDAIWRWQTLQLLKGTWPFPSGSTQAFEAWQARLVAEMRYGLTAVRSSAWCAVLAPMTILLGMNVYPPVNERMMTTAAIMLILSAFALIMYVVILLEQHPLLGRMFTASGDRLSIGGVIGALWGKLVAAALILIPVLFPDALAWLYRLLQSIDSLR